MSEDKGKLIRVPWGCSLLILTVQEVRRGLKRGKAILRAEGAREREMKTRTREENGDGAFEGADRVQKIQRG